MAIFATAYKAVRTVEAGYANDPDDPGKRTYAGVSEKSWPNWAGWGIINLYDKLQLTLSKLNASLNDNVKLQQLVLDFYKDNFWDVLKLDDVHDQNIAAELFDTGVNMGLEISATFLQRCLNAFSFKQNYGSLTVDGQIGSKTIAAINDHTQTKTIFKALNCLQGERYIMLSEKNPVLKKYMASWYSRVFI
jgi:lysozyme family protein